METQKIVNLLNGSDNENSKFATKKWYIIDSESNGNYSKDEEIKFLTRSIESSLCDYSDAYILITGNVTSGGNDTKAAFKNCAPFTTCKTCVKITAVKIVLSLKYLSNFWRSFEMPLINCKVKLLLTWNETCILSSEANNPTFAVTHTKLYVPIVTLKTEDNTKLSKLLSKRLKRPVYWNEHKVIPSKNYGASEYIR